MRTTFEAVMSAATAEAFRSWGGGLSNALTTIGLVKVPVAGQVDWDTVTPPATGSWTMAGFEIWRFDDDLQATHPLFIKIEYGVGLSATSIGLVLTVGKGLDGVNIAQPFFTGRVGGSSSGGSTGSTSARSLVSSCPNRSCVAVVLGYDSDGSHAKPSFIIERSRDNSGAPTGDGLSASWVTGTSSMSSGAPNPFVAIAYDSGAVNRGGVPVAVPFLVNGVQLAMSSSLATGVIAPVLPWLAFAPGLAPWQPLASLSYAPGDAVGGSEIMTRILGLDRRYKVVPISVNSNGWGMCTRDLEAGSQMQSRLIGLMILWEED